ncbi:MAG: hypothetical protein HRU70_07615 [Phycisphaeraceae bacterium]|nr:MAG: hypothetical protein HRU70_07615 [Phycisphaeraceae bacterium]
MVLNGVLASGAQGVISWVLIGGYALLGVTAALVVVRLIRGTRSFGAPEKGLVLAALVVVTGHVYAMNLSGAVGPAVERADAALAEAGPFTTGATALGPRFAARHQALRRLAESGRANSAGAKVAAVYADAVEEMQRAAAEFDAALGAFLEADAFNAGTIRTRAQADARFQKSAACATMARRLIRSLDDWPNAAVEKIQDAGFGLGDQHDVIAMIRDSIAFDADVRLLKIECDRAELAGTFLLALREHVGRWRAEGSAVTFGEGVPAEVVERVNAVPARLKGLDEAKAALLGVTPR